MKQFLLLLFFLPFVVFSQFRNDTLDLSQQKYFTFPQTSDYPDIYDYSQIPFITVQDPNTGQWETVQNTDLISRSSYDNIPFTGTYWISSHEENVPPILDELADGNYLFYYHRVAYLDKDTVKFKKNVVSAVIPVLNNEVSGTVRWYYPNGTLMQESEYLNGEKHGTTFFQFVTPLQETNSFIQVFTDTKNYQHNLLNGLRIVLLNKVEKQKKKKKISLQFYKTINYSNDTLNGKYESVLNDHELISGDFRMGRAIGKWKIHEWEIVKSKLEVFPRFEFEVNTDNDITYQTFFYRNQLDRDPNGERHYSSYSNLNEHSQYFTEDLSEYPMYEEPYYSEGYHLLSTFDDLMGIPNCVNAKYSSSPNSKIKNIRAHNTSNLIDNNGNKFEMRRIIDSCGVDFDYKNYTEYYRNGQIRCSFDFTKPEELYKSKVYHRTGKVMNEVIYSTSDNLFHQYWYNDLGTLLHHTTHTTNGTQIAIIENAYKKIIDGKEYSQNFQTLNWYYNHNGNIGTEWDQDYLVYAEYNPDLSLRSKHTYNALARKGVIISAESNELYNRFLSYTISADYKTIQISEGIGIGDFELSRTYHSEGILSEADGKRLENNKVLPVSFLSSIALNFPLDVIQQPLTYRSEVFSGKFNVKKAKDDRSSLKANKRKATLSINSDITGILQEFLNYLDNNIYNGMNNGFSPKIYLPEVYKKSLSLEKIQFTITNGKTIHSIQHTAPNGFLLYTYDPILFQSKWYNYYPNELDFDHGADPSEQASKSFLTQSIIDNSLFYESVHLTYNSDTSYYQLNDYANKTEKGFKKYSFEKEFYQIYNDEFVNLTRYDRDDTDSFLLAFEFDKASNRCEAYFNSGKIWVQYIIRNGSIDSIIEYDTLSQIQQISALKNGYLISSENYKNRFLTSTQLYFPEDSIKPDLHSLPENLDPQFFDWYGEEQVAYGITSRNFQNKNQRSHTTKYVNEKIVEQGILDHTTKKGIWTYTYPILGKYTIEFRDSLAYESGNRYNTTLEKICFYDENNQIRSAGTLRQWSSEYMCIQDDYTEQYIIEYNLYNGESTKGKSIPIVNYYPNGNKMNEGLLVNGKPEGLWKWYHSDGLLYQLGKYKNGLRDGRWLEGDLSKIRFMGETCLNTESTEYSSMLKQISVTITYFDEGEAGLIQYHDIHAK